MFPNYPWAGRLGRISECCLYCGSKGPEFSLSSSGTYCLGAECCERRRAGSEPIPELLTAYTEKYERLAREWCYHQGVDYDQTVKNMAEQL